MFVSKKKYIALERHNDELLDIIINKNEVIRKQDKDIETLKIEIKTLKNEADKKDMHIRGLEDSNKLHIDKINDLEKELESRDREIKQKSDEFRVEKRKYLDEKNELHMKIKKLKKQVESQEKEISKLTARYVVDNITISELSHDIDKLEAVIDAYESTLTLNKEIKRQAMDLIEIKDKKGNRIIENKCVLINEQVNGVRLWQILRFL